MKFAAREATSKRRIGSREPIILFSVSGHLFAIVASAVQEIRSTDSLSASANEIACPNLPKVRHAVERNGQHYYAVNAAQHFGLSLSRPTLVLILRQVRTAILVDRIEGMTDISAIYALPSLFEGDERHWYRGLTYIDDCVIPLVHESGFLTADDLLVLESSVREPRSSEPEVEGALQP